LGTTRKSRRVRAKSAMHHIPDLARPKQAPIPPTLRPVTPSRLHVFTFAPRRPLRALNPCTFMVDLKVGPCGG